MVLRAWKLFLGLPTLRGGTVRANPQRPTQAHQQMLYAKQANKVRTYQYGSVRKTF
jgi:hypothetical protein